MDFDKVGEVLTIYVGGMPAWDDVGKRGMVN